MAITSHVSLLWRLLTFVIASIDILASDIVPDNSSTDSISAFASSFVSSSSPYESSEELASNSYISPWAVYEAMSLSSVPLSFSVRYRTYTNGKLNVITYKFTISSIVWFHSRVLELVPVNSWDFCVVTQTTFPRRPCSRALLYLDAGMPCEHTLLD